MLASSRIIRVNVGTFQRLARILQGLLALALIFDSATPIDAKHTSQSTVVTVWYNPGGPVNRFAPSHALGAAIDGHEKGELDQMLSRTNVSEMLTAGLKPLSYRLRTELAGEAWHWNPHGSWSEPNERQGYWTSSHEPGPEQISVSYGYRLPRRGNTIDQANEDGYSRLDDGDNNSFWKSNPYLDQHFTGEANSTLPQWVVIDLAREQQVNGVRLLWAEPFATLYDVQYGRFAGVEDIDQALPELWQTFPRGHVHAGSGGVVNIRLSTKPVVTRFIRVLMKESSGTSNRKSTDVRDRLGYAIREISVGKLDPKGRFLDEIYHAPDNTNQTIVYVSSTDPWHREADKDELIEQLGFDRIFNSGLTNNLPMLSPVPVLYDIPENAAAELRYLEARGYPVARVELGEEPDGQFVAPEDYAALYIQFAKALHAVDPKLKLGGPSFQDIEPGEKLGSIQTGKPAWLRRFLVYLKQRGRLDEYTFSSFEWYPFDDVCQPTAPQLARATHLLTDSFKQMQQAGIGRPVPWIITEYGYSVFGGRAEMDIEGALLNADIVGAFLTLGGDQIFLYGYEPNEVLKEVSCSAGNNMLFLIGAEGNIRQRMPTYYTSVLLTQEWAKPGDELHELYLATANKDSLITAYALLRPDGLWALMLVNKDPNSQKKVTIRFHSQTSSAETGFHGTIDLYQYSRKQYELSADKLQPYPLKDLPPEHHILEALPGLTVELPAYSLSVVRGSLKFRI